MPGGATILVCGVRAVFCAGHRRRGRRRFAQFLPCTAVRDRVGVQPAARRFRELLVRMRTRHLPGPVDVALLGVVLSLSTATALLWPLLHRPRSR